MKQENFTERARGFIKAALTLAMRANHQQLTSVHLLKVLLDDEGLAAGLITAANGDAAGAGQVYLAPGMARLFDHAEQKVGKDGDSFVIDAIVEPSDQQHVEKLEGR